jgi:hypothetical protein
VPYPARSWKISPLKNENCLRIKNNHHHNFLIILFIIYANQNLWCLTPKIEIYDSQLSDILRLLNILLLCCLWWDNVVELIRINFWVGGWRPWKLLEIL